MAKIVLASASPRRSQLLDQIGVEFIVQPSSVDESKFDGQAAINLVQQLAAAKSRDVANKLDKGLVIGADTVVVHHGQVLGKPESDDEAYAMLSKLSGSCHQVITGLAVIDIENSTTRIDYKITEVEMREFSGQEISDYISTGEPMDKAGGYGIQERGAIFVTGIKGSYTNVVGLPVTKLVMICKDLGYQIV
ncbi:Maf family protein [Acetohalobium arabaticum]|uniref:dTTP/UTP pyrophosphatase n=1 Tax=Acetohalobium arabaticum (strain ATCC 49924 / DSM 5501 / Z-7288) TaxID=574087 RepID=D9QV38_ACEAZ|nr:Maf family protein [Acetohalobium arabaticum]ADL12097.1 maf protein [Acetohalobium arabaticum DSM 5501]